MTSTAPPSLEAFCQSRQLCRVATARRVRVLWFERVKRSEVIFFTLADGALVEIDASTVDWSVAAYHGNTGTLLWEEWYDVYAHTGESGGNVSLQYLRSIQAFIDAALAPAGVEALPRLTSAWW